MDRWYVKKIKMAVCEDESYLASLPIVKFLNETKELDFDSAVTFLVGENGTGKSTLIEAIAVCAGYNAEGGSKNFTFSTAQTVSDLHRYMTIVKQGHEKDGFFLRAESFYNLASQVDGLGLHPAGYGGRSLHAQSHGESFLSLVQNRFRGHGLYILDEPESALSPVRQLTLLAEMNQLVRADSQFIIATHSPILLAFPKAAIYEITEKGIRRIRYEDCEQYRLTKQFLDDPKRFMAHLFAE